MVVKKGKSSATALSNVLGLGSAQPASSLFCSTVRVGLPEVWLHLAKARLGQGMALAAALVWQCEEHSDEGTVLSVSKSMGLLKSRGFVVLNSTSTSTVLFRDTNYFVEIT